MSRFKNFDLLFWIFYPNFAKPFWFFLCFGGNSECQSGSKPLRPALLPIVWDFSLPYSVISPYAYTCPPYL